MGVESGEDNKTLREMTLVGHLSEIRRRIVISVVAVLVGTLVAYNYIDELMRLVIAPAGKLYFMSPAEGFFAYLKLSVFNRQIAVFSVKKRSVCHRKT